MKYIYLTSALAILVLNGCAGGTTDPRKGGLFSYNPDAYEQRLSDRKNHLTSVENDTDAQKRKNARLKNELATEKSKMH